MYGIAVLLHSYTRWLVLLAMVWALYRAWSGLILRRQWTEVDRRAGWLFATVISVQLLLGLTLFFYPGGLAQAALRNMAVAMKNRELRFFGLEHPLQMVIAVGLVHLGSARSRKATSSAVKYRWAVICYTLATLAIVIAIPWWRPFFRY